ncbi:hypothetical protein J3Q64DRAFT_1432750 [Phycomyces blakesleeanus]
MSSTVRWRAGSHRSGCPTYALQFRWLLPLLFPARATLSIPIRWLRAHISMYSSASPFHLLDPTFFFFFSTSRKGTFPFPSALSLFFSAYDKLPSLDIPPSLSFATCFSLPLSAIYHSLPHNTFFSNSRFHQLLVSDAFYYDPLLLCFSRLHLSSRTTCPILINRFFRIVDTHTQVIHPFFASLCLPPSHPSASHDSSYGTVVPMHLSISFASFIRQLKLSRHSFRLLCPPPDPNPHQSVSRLSPRQWNFFWFLTLSTSTHNIWFRLLHNSLSPASILHAIITSFVASPKCRLCGYSNQTPEHFLVECPLVWQVWTMTMHMWIPHWQAQPSTILRTFYALALPPSPPHINSYHVLDGVLAAVWKAYWRTIFDDVPFVPANVVVSVNESLQFFFQSSHLLD